MTLWLPKRSAYRYWSSLCITCFQFEDKIGLNSTEIGFPLLWTARNSVPSLGRVKTWASVGEKVWCLWWELFSGLTGKAVISVELISPPLIYHNCSWWCKQADSIYCPSLDSAVCVKGLCRCIWFFVPHDLHLLTSIPNKGVFGVTRQKMAAQLDRVTSHAFINLKWSLKQ